MDFVVFRCSCGKVAHQSLYHAIIEAKRQPGKLPMWVYECRYVNKGTFHLTTKKGKAKLKIKDGGI